MRLFKFIQFSDQLGVPYFGSNYIILLNQFRNRDVVRGVSHVAEFELLFLKLKRRQILIPLLGLFYFFPVRHRKIYKELNQSPLPPPSELHRHLSQCMRPMPMTLLKNNLLDFVPLTHPRLANLANMLPHRLQQISAHIPPQGRIPRLTFAWRYLKIEAAHGSHSLA